VGNWETWAAPGSALKRLKRYLERADVGALIRAWAAQWPQDKRVIPGKPSNPRSKLKIF
jgi:hypothetical protein